MGKGEADCPGVDLRVVSGDGHTLGVVGRAEPVAGIAGGA
jgi:hypothetical protein